MTDDGQSFPWQVKKEEAESLTRFKSPRRLGKASSRMIMFVIRPAKISCSSVVEHTPGNYEIVGSNPARG